jgi:hypothetical protein
MTDDTRTQNSRKRSVDRGGPDGRRWDGDADGSVKPEEPGNLIEAAGKVMRIGSMIKQLLERSPRGSR